MIFEQFTKAELEQIFKEGNTLEFRALRSKGHSSKEGVKNYYLKEIKGRIKDKELKKQLDIEVQDLPQKKQENYLAEMSYRSGHTTKETDDFIKKYTNIGVVSNIKIFKK